MCREGRLRTVGLVVGSSIYHVGYQFGSLRQNQELDVLSQAMYQARELAMTRMEEEADQLGADGVVGVRLDIGRYEWGADMAEFIAIGTAIRHKEGKLHRAPNGRPFTSDLSGQAFWTLMQTGKRPVGMVMGSCVYHVAHRGMMQSIRQTGQNVELEQYTQALYDARELAMERMQKEAEAIGDGVLGIVEVKLHENNHGWGSHVIEFFAVGTAVIPNEHVGADQQLPDITPVLTSTTDPLPGTVGECRGPRRIRSRASSTEPRNQPSFSIHRLGLFGEPDRKLRIAVLADVGQSDRAVDRHSSSHWAGVQSPPGPWSVPPRSMAVGIADVTTDLVCVLFRGRQEIRAPRAPFGVHGLDVLDPDIQEGVHPIRIRRRLERHGRLVVRRTTAHADDDEAVAERDVGRLSVRLSGEDDSAAEHLGVEAPRARDIFRDDEVGQHNLLGRRWELGHLVPPLVGLGPARDGACGSAPQRSRIIDDRATRVHGPGRKSRAPPLLPSGESGHEELEPPAPTATVVVPRLCARRRRTHRTAAAEPGDVNSGPPGVAS